MLLGSKYFLKISFLLFILIAHLVESKPVMKHILSEKDIYACAKELDKNQFNGSCLTLGVFSKKLGHNVLFEKIERICLQKVLIWFKSSQAVDPLLDYYPKCKYKFLDSRIKRNKDFNEKSEIKNLVRFLYST